MLANSRAVVRRDVWAGNFLDRVRERCTDGYYDRDPAGALGGWVVLYGLAFGIALGIKALHKHRERQQSALPAAVDEVPAGLFSGAAAAYTLSVMTRVQGGSWRWSSF